MKDLRQLGYPRLRDMTLSVSNVLWSGTLSLGFEHATLHVLILFYVPVILREVRTECNPLL